MDSLLSLLENNLLHILLQWIQRDNEGHPHMGLGPGIPQLSLHLLVLLQVHRLPKPLKVSVTVVEYFCGGQPVAREGSGNETLQPNTAAGLPPVVVAILRSYQDRR